jgi:hypothetical protein
MNLHHEALDARTLEATRGCILKAREDWVLLHDNLPKLEVIWNQKISQRYSGELETDFGFGTVTARRG